MNPSPLPDAEAPFYEPAKPSALSRFLWQAAGADARILQDCPYGEQVKFACLGGIVLATGIMAGLAAGYAFYTVFGPKGENPSTMAQVLGTAGSAVAGFLWGLMIYNLDRYIVASTGKGDGTDTITKKEFFNALPRMALGAVIGITISAPLEIRIFKPEIDAALFAERQSVEAEYRKRIEANFAGDLGALDEQIAALRSQVEQKQQRADAAQRNATEEMDGSGGSRVRSQGPIYQAKQRLADQERAQLEELKGTIAQRIGALDEQVAAKKASLADELAKGEAVAAGLDGFRMRMKLGHEIAGPAVSAFITLLFVFIELTPILFKLMVIKGPYDYLEENVKEYIKASRGIELTHEYLDAGGKHELVERSVFHGPQAALSRFVRRREAETAIDGRLTGAWQQHHEDGIEAEPARYLDPASKTGG